MNLYEIIENSKLNLHQEFQLITDKELLDKMDKQQLIDLYISMYKLLMTKDNIIKEFLKQDLNF